MQCLKQNAKECVGDSMPKNIFNQEIKVIRAVFNKKIAAKTCYPSRITNSSCNLIRFK